MRISNEEEITFRSQKDIMQQLGIQAPVIFDVGANIGQSILKYRDLFPKSKLYSFEANPEIMPQLTRTTSHLPAVQVFNLALSDSIGESEFYVTSVHEASSLLQPEHFLMELSREKKYDFHKVVVPTLTLDAFVEQHKPETIDILKIDVQGAELKVLHGSRATLASGIVKSIYIEVNLASTYVEQMSLTQLLQFMTESCFQLWDILPFVYTRVGKAWTANAIFIQNDVAKKIEAIE